MHPVKYTWEKHWYAIGWRTRQKKYKKQNIKNFLTMADVEKLWFRDKAVLMDKPSLDRIKSDKHYTPANCRFIEQRVNSARDLTKKTSSYIGIMRVTRFGIWLGERMVNGKKIKTRCCDNEKEAVKEYEKIFKVKPIHVKHFLRGRSK